MNHKWPHFHPRGYKSCLSFNHWDTHTHTHTHTQPWKHATKFARYWDCNANPRVSLRQPDQSPGSQSRQWAKGRILTFEKLEQEMVDSSDKDLCIIKKIHECQHPMSQCPKKWVKIPDTAPKVNRICSTSVLHLTNKHGWKHYSNYCFSTRPMNTTRVKCAFRTLYL